MRFVAYVGYAPCGAKRVGNNLVWWPGWYTHVYLEDEGGVEEVLYENKKYTPGRIKRLLEEKYGVKLKLVEKGRFGNKHVFCANYGYEYVFEPEPS